MESSTAGMLHDSDNDLDIKINVQNNIDENVDCNENESYYLVPNITDESPGTSIADVVGTGESSTMSTCRVCATTTDHIIPIFKGDGLIHQLSSKIEKYLPIEVKETDKLPLHLCFHCTATLLAWHEISEGCLSAQQRLIQMQEELEKKHQFFSSDSLDQSMMSKVVLENNLVEQTLLEIPEEFVTDGIQSKVTPEISSEVPILVPNEVSTALHNKISMEVPTEDAIPVTMEITNNESNHASSRMAEASTHVTNEASNEVSNKVETDVSNLDERDRYGSNESPIKVFLDIQHLSEELDEETGITMDEKSKTDSVWLSYGDLAQIQQPTVLLQPIEFMKTEVQQDEEPSNAKKESAPYQCEECGRGFKLKDSYHRHLRIHKDERPFTCHVCGKQFRDSGGLSRHLKDVHAKVKNFSCESCGRRFASRATRDDHQRIHTGERPYVCDSCGKAFKSKASLYTHSKLHTDDFPHSCLYCKKKFRRKQEVLAHITTHTGEKNFECEICLKRFRVKSELVRHRRVHSDDKPFTCTLCGFAFRQKRYLNNHIKSRHVETLQLS